MGKVRVASSGEDGREDVAGRQKGHTGQASQGSHGVVPDTALRPPAPPADPGVQASRRRPRRTDVQDAQGEAHHRASAMASSLCSRAHAPLAQRQTALGPSLAWLRNHSLWIVSCIGIVVPVPSTVATDILPPPALLALLIARPSSLPLFSSSTLLHPTSSTRLPHHYSNTHSLYPLKASAAPVSRDPTPFDLSSTLILHASRPPTWPTAHLEEGNRPRRVSSSPSWLLVSVSSCLHCPATTLQAHLSHRVACSRDALDRSSSLAPARRTHKPLFAYMRTGRLCACGTPSSSGFPHRSHNCAR